MAAIAKAKEAEGDVGKVAVFRSLRRGDRIHAIMLPDCWKQAYRMLDASEFCHERINHARCFSEGRSHINGIEHFWSQA